VLLEDLHHLGEVPDRSAEPVHLVDDHAVDLAGLGVGEQPPQCGPVHVGARVAAVVVLRGQRGPTFTRLAANVCLSRVTLGVQGVEILVETLLRGLPRV